MSLFIFPPHGIGLLPFIWVWLTSGLLCLFIAGCGLFLSLQADSLLILIEEIKLLFILIILPLLPFQQSNTKSLFQWLIDFGLFVLLFLPLSIVGVILRETGVISLIGAHLLLLFAWLIISRAVRISLRWYYLAVFTISAVMPIAYYFMLELYHRDITALLYLNPFYLLYTILK